LGWFTRWRPLAKIPGGQESLKVFESKALSGDRPGESENLLFVRTNKTKARRFLRAANSTGRRINCVLWRYFANPSPASPGSCRFEQRLFCGLVGSAQDLAHFSCGQQRAEVSGRRATESPAWSVDDAKAARPIGSPFHHGPLSPADSLRRITRVPLRSEQRCHAELSPHG
jgi:hypothetical protein